MDFLIRFTQSHETFRLPEIQALAELHNVPLEVINYKPEAPYCLVRLPSVDAAKALVKRSILTQEVHELWGSGATLDLLHQSVKSQTSNRWSQYFHSSFKFTHDSFQGARSMSDRLAMINSFAYLGFQGEILMSDPSEEFKIFEEWPPNAVQLKIPEPDILYLGRFISHGGRDLMQKYDLKKRGYIATTTMDAELALVTANLALAGPGKLIYDPFVGTGSFPVACAHFGAFASGSDINGRSIRGSGGDKSIKGNFKQYGLSDLLGDYFSADLTHTPIRVPSKLRLFDAILCDPPYGVREGLYVLGCRDPEKAPWVIEAGRKNWKYASALVGLWLIGESVTNND
jgi:tRNA (guanine10-N2)-methyltransferase